MTQKNRYIVVDDHSLITDALSLLLASEDPGSEVLVANDAAKARELFSLHASDTDLLILDLTMPGVTGTSLLEEFMRGEPSLKILVLSGKEDDETMVRVLQLGAAGFVPKTLDSELLVSAIKAVMKGEVYLPSRVIEECRRRALAAAEEPHGEAVSTRGAQLTPRQMDVLRELAKGSPIKRICTNLGLSEGTVKTHVAAIYRAFGAANRTEALIAARRAGYRMD